jgi:hypothetical protein
MLAINYSRVDARLCILKSHNLQMSTVIVSCPAMLLTTSKRVVLSAKIDAVLNPDIPTKSSRFHSACNEESSFHGESIA